MNQKTGLTEAHKVLGGSPRKCYIYYLQYIPSHDGMFQKKTKKDFSLIKKVVFLKRETVLHT